MNFFRVFAVILSLAVFAFSSPFSFAATGTAGISITVPGTSTPPLLPIPSGGSSDNIFTVEGQPTTGIVMKGFAYPNAVVTFLRNGAVIGTSVIGAEGTFERTFLVPSGTATYAVWARDSNGLLSQTVRMTVDVVEDTGLEIFNLAISPTISAAPAGPAKTLVLFGSAFPGSRVRAFNNFSAQGQPFSATASSDGRWQISIPASRYNPASYSFKVNYQIEFPGIVSPFNYLESITKRECSNSDLNGDKRVNVVDLSILLYYWNQNVRSNPIRNECVDRNDDGRVDLRDFSILMYEWTG